jgi:hypothetical protein
MRWALSRICSIDHNKREGGREQLTVRIQKIPRGCFALRDWNEDTLIVDPRAPVRALDRVLIYRPDDLRIRIAGTYVPKGRSEDRGSIRIHVNQGHDEGGYHEFDRELVAVAKIMRTDRARQ